MFFAGSMPKTSNSNSLNFLRPIPSFEPISIIRSFLFKLYSCIYFSAALSKCLIKDLLVEDVYR